VQLWSLGTAFAVVYIDRGNDGLDLYADQAYAEEKYQLLEQALRSYRRPQRYEATRTRKPEGGTQNVPRTRRRRRTQDQAESGTEQRAA
jgi:hypothetical protein